MAIARYWGDPFTPAIGYGWNAGWERLRELERQKREQETAQRKKRQKNTAIIGTAVVGGVIGGIAAAPAAAAIPGAGVAAGGAAAGGFSTAGALTGAQIGAGVGELIGGGEPDALQQGLSQAAGYAFRTNERQADRQFSARQSELDRSFQTSERTARGQEAIGRAVELSTVAETGLTRSELDAVQRHYGPGPGGMDQQGGGGGVGPGAPGSAMAGPPAPGDGPDLPGPSDIPGMEKVWGPSQYRALARLNRERDETVGNPEWVRSHTPQVAAAQQAALNRTFNDIRTTLRPAQPKFMIPGPDGGMAAGHPGWNGVPGGGSVLLGLDGSFEQYVAPTKHQEAEGRSYPLIGVDGRQVDQPWGSSVETEPGLWRNVDEDGKLSWYRDNKDDPMAEVARRARAAVKPDSDGQVDEFAPQNAVKLLDAQDEAAWLGELHQYTPETITRDQLIDLGSRLAARYGSFEAAPQDLQDEYLRLRQRFMGPAPPNPFPVTVRP